MAPKRAVPVGAKGFVTASDALREAERAVEPDGNTVVKDAKRDAATMKERRGGPASKVSFVVARESERANALRPVPCVYELNPVAFIP